MSTKRQKKKFQHIQSGHVVETSLPVEQTRLLGSGYREVKQSSTAAQPSGKPAESTKK